MYIKRLSNDLFVSNILSYFWRVQIVLRNWLYVVNVYKSPYKHYYNFFQKSLYNLFNVFKFTREYF